MTSFGANTGALSQRAVVSEHALQNWYKLLKKQDISLIPNEILLELDKDLIDFIHNYPRTDIFFVVGLLKVWALNYKLLFSNFFNVESFFPLAFDNLLEHESIDLIFLNNIAFYIITPVDRPLVPLIFQKSAHLSLSSEKITISDAGLMLLFALWHKLRLGKFLQNNISDIAICEKKAKKYSRNYTPRDVTRMDAMQSCSRLSSLDIYSHQSNINIYARLKLSSLDETERVDFATFLFDFDPADYCLSIIGKIIILGKVFEIPVLFGDEILFVRTSRHLWLLQDKDYNFVTLFYNLQVRTFPADENGLCLIQTYLEKCLGTRSEEQ
jgi:hypothetical protein